LRVNEYLFSLFSGSKVPLPVTVRRPLRPRRRGPSEKDEEQEAHDRASGSSVSPLDLPGHEAAGQDIHALQYPDNSNSDQKHSHNTQKSSHR